MARLALEQVMPAAWVDAATARAHVSTDRLIKASKGKRP